MVDLKLLFIIAIVFILYIIISIYFNIISIEGQFFLVLSQILVIFITYSLVKDKNKFISGGHNDCINFKNNSNIIFITGKGSAGKSYISQQAKNNGYFILELDNLLLEMAKDNNIGYPPHYSKIFKLYKNIDIEPGIIDKFINKIHDYIKNNKKIIIEGAISEPKLIKKIFKGYNYKIIFLYIASKQNHFNRLKKRYDADINNNTRTLPFWNYLDQYLDKPIDFLKKQVKIDMDNSKKRYDYFIKNGLKVCRHNV